MRIVVCIKQVPDSLEVRLREDYTLERDFVAQVMNPADESALEWALRVRGAMGGTVTAVSMGPARAEGMLREALARGADEAVLLTDPHFAGADTLVTARCLAAAVGALGGADLIACGRRAADGETGQVGPMLASMLDIPCVVNAISADAAETLTVWQLAEDGTNTWSCGYPALVTFCEWTYPLRLPTLAGLRRAQKAEVSILTPEALGLAPEACGLRASPTRVKRVEARASGIRPCRYMDAAACLALLADRYPEAFT